MDEKTRILLKTKQKQTKRKPEPQILKVMHSGFARGWQRDLKSAHMGLWMERPTKDVQHQSGNWRKYLVMELQHGLLGCLQVAQPLSEMKAMMVPLSCSVEILCRVFLELCWVFHFLFARVKDRKLGESYCSCWSLFLYFVATVDNLADKTPGTVHVLQVSTQRPKPQQHVILQPAACRVAGGQAESMGAACSRFEGYFHSGWPETWENFMTGMET